MSKNTATIPPTEAEVEVRASAPIVAPASEPQAAVSQPASGPTPARQKPSPSHVRNSGINFEDDATKCLPGYPAEKAADYMRCIACYVVDGFKGATRAKGGVLAQFSFAKHEVVLLPKWFALQHPKRLVPKE